eukprot:snap_masked-scaffold10_size831480-processed-gene-3.3 protein:Tk01820 transcript:snap_masked-scaffold10_size831480-processed-gene-3.3-mRNA-1 annotation:"iduronate 2-sulfatase-like"
MLLCLDEDFEGEPTDPELWDRHGANLFVDNGSLHGLSWYNFLQSPKLRNAVFIGGTILICIVPIFIGYQTSIFLNDKTVKTTLKWSTATRLDIPNIAICHPMYFNANKMKGLDFNLHGAGAVERAAPKFVLPLKNLAGGILYRNPLKLPLGQVTSLSLTKTKVDRSALNSNWLTESKDLCISLDADFETKYGMPYTEINCEVSFTHHRKFHNCSVTPSLDIPNVFDMKACEPKDLVQKALKVEENAIASPPIDFQAPACQKECIVEDYDKFLSVGTGDFKVMLDHFKRIVPSSQDDANSIVCFWFHLGIHRVLDLKPAQPNVLFIIVDDLRPALGVYGDSAAVTPHLDQLGAFGTVFTRAFAQFSVCGPSRASLLSSRKPDTLGCWHNGCDFEKYGNFTGLPEFFRSRGYHTTGYGKIYHNVYGSGMFGLPLSAWTVKPRRPLSQLSKRDRVCSPNETFDLFCPVDMLKHPFTRFSDSDSKRKVVRFLEKYAARRTTQPFFYAAGLYLPHVPMKFPKYLLDLYPRNKFLAHPQRATYGVENATSFTCNDWWTVMNLPKWKGLSVSPELELEFKRHYYASTTFMDYQIGMIVQALTDTKLIENTIISVVADHGFALGEHGFLAKRLNLDVGLQVPWIVWNPRTHVRATFKLFHPKDLIDHPDRVPKLSPGHMIGQLVFLFALTIIITVPLFIFFQARDFYNDRTIRSTIQWHTTDSILFPNITLCHPLYFSTERMKEWNVSELVGNYMIYGMNPDVVPYLQFRILASNATHPSTNFVGLLKEAEVALELILTQYGLTYEELANKIAIRCEDFVPFAELGSTVYLFGKSCGQIIDPTPIFTPNAGVCFATQINQGPSVPLQGDNMRIWLNVDRSLLNGNILTPEEDKCVSQDEEFGEKFKMRYSEYNCGLGYMHFVYKNCTFAQLGGYHNARVGGWLGLAMGASILSVVEIIVFFGYLVRLIFSYWAGRDFRLSSQDLKFTPQGMKESKSEMPEDPQHFSLIRLT